MFAPAETPRRDALQLRDRRPSDRGAPTLWDRKPIGRPPGYRDPRDMWLWSYGLRR